MTKEDIAKQKNDEIKRKVFLGGLNKQSSEVTIENYFRKFGEIEDILINRNIADNSSKGCAFLLFRDVNVAQELVKSKAIHMIEGNHVEVKQCYEKSKSKALKEEKMKQSSCGDGMNGDGGFMGMFGGMNNGANMNIMNEFMNTFIMNLTGGCNNTLNPQANLSGQQLLQNTGFQSFLNNSHSNMMLNYQHLKQNNLVAPVFMPQNCPVYGMTQPIQQAYPPKFNQAPPQTRRGGCPLNFMPGFNQRQQPTAQQPAARSKCPFGNHQAQKPSAPSVQTKDNQLYGRYMKNKQLLVNNNPHLESGYPSTGFNRCPLAHLLNQGSDSEGDKSSQESVSFEFETQEIDRIQTKSFKEMAKKSKKFELLHKEDNLKFRWKPKAKKSRCPFAKKGYNMFSF